MIFEKFIIELPHITSLVLVLVKIDGILGKSKIGGFFASLYMVILWEKRIKMRLKSINYVN